MGEPPLLNIGQKSKSFRLPKPISGIWGRSNHNQGVGLLADASISGRRYARAVLSFNSNDSTGFKVFALNIPVGVDGVNSHPSNVDYLEKERTLDIQDEQSYGRHDHPGGLQAHGDYVAVAMEQPKEEDNRAAVYFIRVDGFEPRHVYTHFLGGQPSNISVSLDAAASVGFIKLAPSGFLMAVAGADNGKNGIWFFDSKDSTINPTMNWKYVDFWEPDRMPDGVCDIKDGKVNSNCYIGAGGTASLVTDCDGQIYLVCLTGTSGRGKDYEYAQIMHLSRDASGRIKLESIWHDKRPLGFSVLREISFRWGAGVNVSTDGKLVLLSTEKRHRKSDNDYVDGIIRISGQNTLNI
ncbi:hypothetical protein HRE53_32245 (plasmid) [Acaryochloris sp. 'Moss Beach']|uniref:hypothetical protein n=1 Tax=Acaryochloris sp. 'Moss Beach' TaxID=2740837 RepID=UPI001F3498C8|nr:hypothetical protein [Acaryochloris sp. 'Moss Beach']UJB73323.1 hypothetical protein HRE53_32245 [Acaryochloris sp. 'Moss Beach']